MDLPLDTLAILTFGIFIVAVLYSAVGNAGSTGYIAVMSLMGITSDVIKPSSLFLNLLVATVGAYQYLRAGHFAWHLFWPLMVLSVPLAFVGGYIHLPERPFQITVGVVLLCSAILLLVKPPEDQVRLEPNRLVAVILGGMIGLLSGLTGTGGGVFLMPLLLFMGWATTKTAAGVSILFILLNSIAALFGNLSSTHQLPAYVIVLALAAGLGGALGSYHGSRHLQPVIITRALAAVLILAAAKLILTK